MTLSFCAQPHKKSYWKKEQILNKIFAIHYITNRMIRVWPLFLLLLLLVIYFKHSVSILHGRQCCCLNHLRNICPYRSHSKAHFENDRWCHCVCTVGIFDDLYWVTAGYTWKCDGQARSDTIYSYDCYNWVLFFLI